MKKLMLIGLIFLAGTAFCQNPVTDPLTPDQEKKVADINKTTQGQLKDLVKNNQMAAADKRTNVQTLKSNRDGQLAAFLSTGQVVLALKKDPVKWDDAMKQIDKQDKEQQKEAEKKAKAEKKQKVDDLNKQEDDLSKQMDDLKKKEDDLKTQKKEIEAQKKEIK